MQLAGCVGPIPSINYHGQTAHAAHASLFGRQNPRLLVSYRPLANIIRLDSIVALDSCAALLRSLPRQGRASLLPYKQTAISRLRRSATSL